MLLPPPTAPQLRGLVARQLSRASHTDHARLSNEVEWIVGIIAEY